MYVISILFMLSIVTMLSTLASVVTINEDEDKHNKQ